MPPHFVKVVHTAYPLAPSNGYASERTVEVYAPLGYATDRVCRIETEGNRGIEQAKLFAAALSGISVEDVDVQTEYAYRDHRNAIVEQTITATEAHTRFAKSCRVTQDEHSSLIWSNLNPERHAMAVEAVRETIGAGRRETRDLSREIAERLYGDDSDYGRALRGD